MGTGVVPPTPMTGGICSTGPCIGTVHYFPTGGGGKALTCTSNLSMIACKSATASPHLTVYNASGTSILYTSCATPSATSCTSTATDPCGTTVHDFLNESTGPPLIGSASDGTIIIADSMRIYRFKAGGSQAWATCMPSAAQTYTPTGTILTSDSSGNENVTLLMNQGPVVTFQADTGAVVSTGGSATFQPDPGTDSIGAYYYSGNNSACAVGNRIYPAMNKYYTTASQTLDAYQDGVLYALQISHSDPGIAIAASFWFGDNSIMGPSKASPMCSPAPDNGIFTDFGSLPPGFDPQGNAGVLAVTDCTSSVWSGTPPAYCSSTNPNWPFQLRYTLPTDPTLSGCTSGCLDYIMANLAWDPGNACFWARPHNGTGAPITTMSCVSSGVSGGSIVSPTVVKTINVASLGTALPGSPRHETPGSDAIMTNTASDGSGSTIMLLGTVDTTAGNQAVMAINTTASGGSLYWYYLPYSFVGGQFGMSTDSYSNPLVWFVDNAYGTYAIGDCGGTGQQSCQFPE